MTRQTTLKEVDRQAKQKLIRNDSKIGQAKVYPEPMLLETLGGLKLAGFQRPKPLLLLTYLALEGPQNRRHLAELFWPDAADPMKSLTVALTRLRQGAPNVVDADNVRAWATVKTDAQEMVELLEQGKLEEALAVYRGPFLEGFYLPDWSVELEEWVYKTREFLAGQVREALLGLAERAAREGQFATSAKYAEVAYQLPGATTPEPEDLPRFYTHLLAGGSSQAAQVRQEAQSYGLKLTLSADEARKQWQQTPDFGKTPVYSRLPTRATAFVGRDLELTEIATLLSEQALLSEQTCQLLTLVGPPGVGKTRLALQIAREQARLGLFKDGVYFVGLEVLNAETLFPSILSTLEIDPHGSEEPLEKIIRYIGEKNILLMLDNFEHLIESAPFVATLAKACPNLKLLITSRERLNLEGEQIFQVGGLPFPTEDMSLEEAQNFDAISLFVQRARRVKPENLPHILRLCRFVEGLPLALELAAAWVRVMSCEEMSRELKQNLDLFSTMTRDVPERHKSIRLAFERCSWTLLSSKEQEVLRKLSVFRGGFRREAASEVAGATIPVLASLVDKSLLRVSPTGRYDFHPLLYQYIQEKLAEHPDEKKKVEAKHGEYYLRISQQEGEKLKRSQQKEALNAISEELENVRTALEWALAEERLTELRQMLNPLRVFFDRSNRHQEGVVLFAQVLAGLSEANPDHHTTIGAVLKALAWKHLRLGRYEEAEQLVGRGLELLRSLNDPHELMDGQNVLAQIAYRMGRYEEARQHRGIALALARQTQDRFWISQQLGLFGSTEQQAGNYGQAVQHLQEALSLSQKDNYPHLVISQLINLGVAHLEAYYLPEARACFEEALELAREMSYREALLYCLSNLGETAREEKNYSEAQTLFEESLQIAREGGEKFVESYSLTRLGKVAVALHNLSRAYEYFERALQLARAIESTPAQLLALIGFAELQLEQRQPEQAAHLLSLVCHHPATLQGDRDETRQLLQGLRDQLSPEVMEEAVKRGETMKLEEVVAEFTR
jgi:predicted ATPase/Flp pilus assembly protein TadD